MVFARLPVFAGAHTSLGFASLRGRSAALQAARNLRRMLRWMGLAAALLLAFATAAPAQELPEPASLEPAIRFWTRVYTEVDSHSGMIHDAESLGVVYETIRFPELMSYRGRDQRTEQAKREIRAILLGLAKGKRDGLTSDEARVLAQWPPDVTDATLSRAAENVRFQAGLADRFRAGLVRSGKWRPFVVKALADRGVPAQLVALPHVESSYNPKAYSRVGAAGMWQFMRSTGRLYMRIDNVVDERLDPYVSSDAAARLLARNREITGTWPLAITAYNHGAGGMQRAARTLGTTDMGEIVRRYRSRSFGFASRNFYASFLAASRIDREPTRYFGAITLESPNTYTEIELPWYTPAPQLARVLGVDLGMLQEHNPALRPAVWNGSKHIPKAYPLRLPSSSLSRPVDELIAAVPASARLAEQHRDRFHKVRRGDTLSRIANRYGVRESELVAANNLRSRNRLSLGQVLVLPGVAAPPTPVREVQVASAEPAEPAAPVAAADAPERSDDTPVRSDASYRVRRGDTLSIIAKRYSTTERDLAKRNNLRNRHRLSVGQRLRVPAVEPVEVASAESAVADVAPAPQAPAEPAPAQPPSTPSAPAPAPAAQPVPVPMPSPTVTATTPVPAPSPAAAPPRAPVTSPEPAEEPPAAIALANPPPASEEAPSAVTEVPGRPPDPSDYSVHGDRVTVQAAETLGHFADWLEMRASDLRKLNRMRFEQPVVIGQKLKLEFSRVSAEEFEQRRLEYHQSLQDEFFEAFSVTGTERHVLEAGESLWYLAQRKYRVPVWLLRQYNPDLDFAALTPGAPLIVPVVEPREGQS
jgi:membrane-bound lytic murein transglycosylase D